MYINYCHYQLSRSSVNHACPPSRLRTCLVACHIFCNSPFPVVYRGLTSLQYDHTNLIFVWQCIINVGKVMQKNQLDAAIIYWSIRSAQHVSGNLLPVIRSVRLRFLQHMVSCCCGGQGVGERQRGTAHHSNRLPYAVKVSVLRSWRWAKDCPKHVELIL